MLSDATTHYKVLNIKYIKGYDLYVWMNITLTGIKANKTIATAWTFSLDWDCFIKAYQDDRYYNFNFASQRRVKIKYAIDNY